MKILIISFFVGLPIFLFGQDKKTTYSLEEAQSYAMEHAYDVIGSNYELKVAQKKVWEAIASGLPQVNVNADYDNNLDLPTSLLPGEITGGEKGTFVPVKFGQQFTANASLSISQLIFDGSYFVGLKASKIYTTLTENKGELVRLQIKRGVTEAYFYVLAALENLKTLKENLESNRKLYEEAKLYYEEGLREETDVDQAKLLVSNSRNLLNDARRSIKTSYMTLKYLMGVEVTDEIHLTDNLDQFIAKALLQKTQLDYDLEEHIDHRILLTQVKSQKLRIGNERSGYLPKLSLFYHYGYNSSSNDWNLAKEEVEWYKLSSLGLKLSLPVFTSGKRNSRVVQEEINLENIENQVKKTSQRLKKEVVLAEDELVKTRENYKNSLENFQLAEKIYTKTRFKYDEGVTNSAELTQNELQYRRAHTSFVSAIIHLLKADVNYRLATGKF